MNADAVSRPAPAAGIPLWKPVAMVALAIATAALCNTDRSMQAGSMAGVRMDLPAVLGPYTGESQEVSEAEKLILPADTEFARRAYIDFDGNVINCQIVLSGGDKRSIHRPEICLPGQGWNVQAGRILPVRLPNGRTLDTMHLTLARPTSLPDGRTIPVYTHFIYWYVGKNRTTPRHTERILLTSLDRIFHNTNHRWAYVVVSATVTAGLVPGGKNADETLEMAKDFIGLVLPYITEPEVLKNL